jgi:hypothetical protein
MTTGLSYDGSVAGTTSYINQIATLAVVEPTDPAFLVVLPQMISYAENRIYRDLDLLLTQNTSSYTLAASTPSVTIPASDYVTLQTILANDGSGNVFPLLPTTREFAQNVYGNTALTGVPKYFFVSGGSGDEVTGYILNVAPTPATGYTLQVTGTFRPASMSATNLTTFISLYVPEMLIMASMIYVSGYQRNFGRANDDPQMAITYESQYQALKATAVSEEYRKKFESSAWSSKSTAVTATPTRG